MTKLYEEISDEELSSLTVAIKSRYGIDFTNYETKSLKRGFARLISKNDMNSLLDLWSKILRDREFFMGCIDDLTVNLTELFRNPEFWNKIHDDILPRFNDKTFLKIWHAGCSTGEEVYSMAVVLNEMNLLRKTRAWATDLSSRVLAKALAGEYSTALLSKYEKGFVNYLPHKRMDDLFKIEGENMYVRDEFKKHVDFHQHNLVQDPVDKKFDLIFCRNVMIYFDDKLKMKVLNLFHQSLNPDGFLIIGYYDMLPNESKDLFVAHDSKTRIYKRL